MALGRRQDNVIDRLVRLLDAPDLYTRYGACQAIKMQRTRGEAAVPALLKTFRSDDLWLRILAAEALAGIGEPAKAAVPEMLERLTKSDPRNDPRNMEQRYLCFALFARRGGLLSRSLEGVDRELLMKAVRAGLRNEDGRARGALGSVYANLSFEEIKPLLPAIHKAVVEPAPSGIMFADGIRLQGLQLLARHRIKEGMPLCLQIMDIERWGKRHRIAQCLKTLASYGGAAKPVLPELRNLEKKLLAHPEARGLKEQIDLVRKTIADIETATDAPELRSLRPAASKGT